MEPIRKRDLSKRIESAFVERLDTGEIQELDTKVNSYCHFFSPIVIGCHRIVFRIDWSDIDENCQPTLDADFYDIDNPKIKLKNKGQISKAHHTSAEDQSLRIYKWSFCDIELPFQVSVTWRKIFENTVGVTDHIKITTYRDGNSDA
ncbi:hypothetical protein HC024_05390 [Methylococcaceae bacterium WWC4]|nr:hypothetical protein [Methylococcaceae bacterium WWC4]